MAVPGEQESFQSQSFRSPKRATSVFSTPGDSSRALAAERQKTRETFFDNRPDVSADRLDRRLIQKQKEKKFIDTLTEVEGTKGTLLQEQAPVFNPMTGKYERTTLAQKRQQLANKYGPTFSEIMSDVTYAGGKILGAMGEKALSGGLGFLGAMNEVVKYATNKARDGYNKLNDVQKQIADNKDKYSLTYNGLPAITSINNNERLALEAQRDLQKFSFAGDASGVLGIDTNRLDGFVNEPTDTLGFGTTDPTVDMRKPTIEELRTIPITQTGVFPAEEIKEAAMDRFSPEYLEQQKKLLDELNISPQVEELKPKEQRELGLLDIINPFDAIPTGMALGEFINPEMYDIQKFKDTLPEGSSIPEMVDTIVGGDDQASITKYNNPFNLEFKGQEGAEPGYGGESGQRFASFDTLDRGLKAGIERVAEIVGDGRTTEEFLDIYAPKSDNPKSYDNYLASLKRRVGPTIEPNEIKDLTKGVIRFENTADIAGQYLDYLQRENDRIYGGIVS